MRQPIIPATGFYKDANLHWSSQDVLHFLPIRAERPGTRTQYQLRGCPGMKPFMQSPVAGVGRGLHNVEGKLLAVVGGTLYQVTNALVAIPRGTIPGVQRVSMAHNQFGLVNQVSIVNGSSGYIYNTGTTALAKITDDGYPGAFSTFFVDGYLGYVEPQGRYWGHSDLNNGFAYNTLDTYEAEGQPDRIVQALVSHREVLVFGRETIEPYVNSPTRQDGLAPFQRAGNMVIESGCASRWTPAKVGDLVVYLDDKRVVQVLDGYAPSPIAHSGVAQAFGECSQAEISQAYAFSWQDDGHKVYYITVPGRFTFGFDFKHQEWHRRATNGMPHWAVSDVVYWNGRWIAQDSRNGNLYELDWKYPREGCDEMVRLWRTPPLNGDGYFVDVSRIEALVNTGNQDVSCVHFLPQPEGPSIEGEAPDGLTGDPYTFTYTTTQGTAPIARTVLRDTVLPAGWSWNEQTATISHDDTPIPVVSITLKMRVFDTNDLYADHEDQFIIAQEHHLLMTGSSVSGADPVFADAVALQPLDIQGIEQSTGADITQAIPSYFDGIWGAATASAFRYSSDDRVTWQSVSLSLTGSIRHCLGGPDGWFVSGSGVSNDYAISGPTPSSFSPHSISVSIGGGSPQAVSEIGFIRFFGGSWWCAGGVTGLLGGVLMRAPTLDTSEWEDVTAVRPNGILMFLDVVEHDGALYAAVYQGFGTNRRQLRRSNDGGVTWPDILIDNETSGLRPYQLESSGNTLLVYCLDGTYVYTSADNYAQPHATGLAGVSGLRRRMIVYTAQQFFIVGQTAAVGVSSSIVSTVSGLSFSTPVALPVTTVKGMAATS